MKVKLDSRILYKSFLDNTSSSGTGQRMFLYYRIKNYLWEKFVGWLTYESPEHQTPLTNFERLRYELRPGDVLLVEGHSNVSEIIKSITQGSFYVFHRVL